MRLYTINFPVGDWTNDGHGKCDYFVVKSNKSVVELTGIHISVKEKLGFDIGEICAEYEDSELSLDIYDKLVNAGFNIEYGGGDKYPEMCRYFYDMDSRYMDTQGVFNLWVDILKFIDPTVDIEEINSEYFTPINTPGYGCHY